MNELDRALAQFARTGEPGALATAYDLAAGELLALAVRLVGDPVEAEDLVQATFVAAIESIAGFTAGRRAMPWLCGILHNRVRRWRRSRRRREPLPDLRGDTDPADAAQHSELQAAVAQALEGVPKLLHAVLVLRLVHQMQPGEIAYALGRPPATVRSQLLRGLQQLRARLPKRLLPAVALLPLPRGLEAIKVAVLAHAGARAAAVMAATASAMTGAVLMANKLAMAAAVVVLASGFVFWAARGGEPAAPRVPAEVPAGAAAAAAAGSTAGEGRRDGPAARAELPLAAAAALRVVVESRGQPVPGALIGVQPEGAADRSAATAADGVAWFASLPAGAGSYRLLGTALGGTYRIEAGATGEVRIEASPPTWLRGVVVREPGGPAADAMVWLAFGERAVAPARDATPVRADGTFELALWSDAMVGARAPGTIPALRQIEATPGTQEIVLSLRLGGATLRGRVVAAADGRPLAGAALELGDRFGWFTGRLRPDGSRESVLPVAAASGDDGTFAVDGLLPGELTVHVRAAGFAPLLQGVVLPPGGVAEVELRLLAGCRVHGTVTQQDGRPAAGARVRAGLLGSFDAVDARTDRDGRFELQAAPVGMVPLSAEQPGWGQSTASAELPAGGEFAWNPVLDANWNGIDGTLQDERGAPLAGWWVVAHSDSRHDAGAPARTGADGRFELRQFSDYPPVLELRVHPRCEAGRDGRPAEPAVTAQQGVRLGSHDLHLTVPDRCLPSAWLRGRIVQKQARGPAPVLLGASGTVRALPVDRDGAFAVGPLAPGRWRIAVSAFPDWAEVAAFELLPREDRDAGAIELPANASGTLAVELAAAGLHRDFKAEFDSAAALQVLTADGLRFVRYANIDREVQMSLQPGRYLVRLCGVPLAPAAREVEVRAGETARVQLEARPAAMRRVAFRHPGTQQPFEPLSLLVRGRGGELVWNAELRPKDGWWFWEMNLEPGTYRLTAQTPSGLHCERELVVESADPGLRPLLTDLLPGR